MTVPVISDSHGYGRRLQKILDKISAIGERADEIIFLGDGAREVIMNAPDGARLYAVLGNCDHPYDSAYDIFDSEGNTVPLERLEMIGGKRVLIMHGHKYGVKVELSRAIERAAALEADVLMYGHTHVPYYKMLPAGSEIAGLPLKKALHVFNPGALMNGCFGVMTVRNGEILLSHGRV